MSTLLLRYQRLPYKGPSTRLDCPACGGRHKLWPYYDTRTGELLPGIYGRCNRAANCGYELSPYDKGPSGMSYATKAYEQWKVDNPIVPRTNYQTRKSVNVDSISISSVANQRLTPVLPVYTIPDEIFTQSIGHYERNNFAYLLQQHFGLGVAAELLHRFQIGTSLYWSGSCVFWLNDEGGRVRGGQVVLFDQNGHTVKRTLTDGTQKRSTNWVHIALANRYDQKQLARPIWLVEYMEKANKFPIPYGLHQLSMIKPGQAVALVESPKTAIICTPYFPQFVWMAIGGLSYLNSNERLKPLQSQKLVLFPDASLDSKAFTQWNNRAIQLRNQGYNVIVSDYLEQRATRKEKEQGYDLADYLLYQWKGYPPDWDTPSLPDAIPVLPVQSLDHYIE